MKSFALIAVTALVLMGAAQTTSYAFDSSGYGDNCTWMYMYPQGYTPEGTVGAGPNGTCLQGPIPVLVCPAPCCPAEVEKRCGAFCTSGQTPPGWQYGWCDEYWLRPNSNL